MKAIRLIAGLAIVAASTAGAQVTVYSNNFSTNNDGFSSNTAIWNTPGDCIGVSGYCGSYLGSSGTAIGYNGGGSGLSLSQQTATLSLTGLAAHTSGTISFDLFIIDSWDGNGDVGFGPDFFSVTANSTQLLNTTFEVYNSSATQSYPNNYYAANSAGDGNVAAGQLGTWYWTATPGYNDVYHIVLNFTDADPDLTVNFIGDPDQSVTDESWALDNVEVQTNATATPEPASLTLLGTGLLAIGGAVIRRRRAAA